MHAAFPSRISRWWCWLIGQFTPASAAHVSAPSLPPRTEPQPLAEIIAFPSPLPESTVQAMRVSQDELIQTLLETVQQTALPVVASPPPLAILSTLYAAERSRTLAALQNLQQIPSLQSLARSFSQATHRDDASVAEVVEAVQKDPALCVRVLRLANSVAISPVERIDDIMSAVQMLGVLRVRKAAHALFTLRDANTVAAGFDWKHLWIHGLATAAIAEELEKELGLPANPQLYLAGLLHDVGKIVLSTISPEIYRSILIDAWNGCVDLNHLEIQRLGVNHREAGVIFAEHCQLHADILAAIAHHGEPSRAGEQELCAALVSLANFVSKSYGLGFSGSRLNESEGEWENQPAWAIITQHRGCAPDLEAVEEQLRKFVVQLKPELKTLREG